MRRVFLVALVALAACGTPTPPADVPDDVDAAAATPSSDEKVTFPAYPDGKRLLPFTVVNIRSFRFFIDRASLSVGKDGVVRYALIARSDAGAENVSYEGMHCASGKMRVYATGAGGAWSGRPTPWRDLATPWNLELYRFYFCPQAKPIRNTQEGIYALESGMNPNARVSGDPNGR